MAIKKITFTNANVTAQNDADLYYFLQGGTGILKGIKNEVKASNNANRFIFESGYISIYGRLLFVDNNTDITVPLNRTAKGYVVLDINTATNIAELTYTESTNGGYPILIQENLSTGVGHYQFAIAAYSKTSAALTPDQSFKPAYLYPHIEKQQGSTNANKVFMTDASGNFILVDTIPVSAIPATGVSVDTAKQLEKKDGTKIGADDVALKKDFNNVDNTSDADKPISNATQQALDLKADKKDVSEVDIDLEGTGTIVSIPENATGYGTIEKLGGKSYKSENLIALKTQNISIHENGGATVSSYSDNTIVMNITTENSNSSGAYMDIPLENDKTYSISFRVSATSNITTAYFGLDSDKKETTLNATSGYVYTSFTTTSPNALLVFYFYTTQGNVVTISDIMLNEGSEALPYEPYFEGIKIEYPTNVKSVGRNLWDEQWEVGSISNTTGKPYANNENIRSKNYIEVTSNTTYYTYVGFGGHENMVVFFYDSNYNYLSNGYYGNKVLTIPNNCQYLKFRMGSQYGTTYKNDIAIIKGTSGTYTPYTEQNLPQTNIINYVSTQLQTNHSWTQENASKWLGLGVGNDSNIINYANNKKGDVKYSIVDLGALSFEYNSAQNRYYAPLSNIVIYKSNTDLANITCSKYTTTTFYNLQNGTTDNIIASYNGYISLRDTSLGTTGTPTGLLIYELATPIEIDLSSLETEEHFECESNGSIIHDNLANYKYSFPVSLKGQVELNFEHDKEQQRDIDSLKNEIDLKANKSETYTKEETNALIDSIVAGETGLTNYYTKSETNKLLNDKANKTDVYTKTETNNELSKKVDKENGKKLSTNDFTNELKSKLDNLSNYDDTSIQSKINFLMENSINEQEVSVSGTADIGTSSLGYTYESTITILKGLSKNPTIQVVNGTDAKINSYNSSTGEVNFTIKSSSQNGFVKATIKYKYTMLELYNNNVSATSLSSE